MQGILRSWQNFVSMSTSVVGMGLFVDDGIVYKTIGAIHGDVAVYQLPVLQRGEVIDDDARATGCDEYLYAFGLSGFQCFDGGSGESGES